MTKKDILEALGIMESKGDDRFWSGLFMGLGAGAFIGGVAALLLAPRRGNELRTAIGDRSRTVVDKLRRRAGHGDAMSETELGSEGMPGGYKPTV